MQNLVSVRCFCLVSCQSRPSDLLVWPIRWLEIASSMVWIENEGWVTADLKQCSRQPEESASLYFLFLFLGNTAEQRKATVCLPIPKKERKRRLFFVWEGGHENTNVLSSNGSIHFSFSPSSSVFCLLRHTQTQTYAAGPEGRPRKRGQTIPGGLLVPEAWLEDERTCRRSVYCLTTACVLI